MSKWIERFQNFQNSLVIFQEVCEDYKTNPTKNAFRLAVIQSYKITFELAWKTMKDYLKENGIVVNLPKEVIKEAFSNSIIIDGQMWIDMLQDRNSTTHEYNQEKADLILEKIVGDYNNQFEQLVIFLKDKV